MGHIFTPPDAVARKVLRRVCVAKGMVNGARKVAVIGAGNVGATCAFVLAERKVGEIVLLDIFEGFAKGKALDMSQGGRVLNYDGRVTGTKDYRDIAESDVVVVTSGFPRQPGMTREDLIGKNADIITQVGNGIKEYAPDSIAATWLPWAWVLLANAIAAAGATARFVMPDDGARARVEGDDGGVPRARRNEHDVVEGVERHGRTGARACDDGTNSGWFSRGAGVPSVRETRAGAWFSSLAREV